LGEVSVRPIEKAHRIYNKLRGAALEGDDEAAHQLEDDLRTLALECAQKHYLGERVEGWGQIVQLALSTSELDFVRWYA
jgi:hypothetical protein